MPRSKILVRTRHADAQGLPVGFLPLPFSLLGQPPEKSRGRGRGVSIDLQMDTRPRPFPATDSPVLSISREAIQQEMSEHQRTSQNPVGSAEDMCLAPRHSPHPTWPCVNKCGWTPHLEADHLALRSTNAGGSLPSLCLSEVCSLGRGGRAEGWSARGWRCRLTFSRRHLQAIRPESQEDTSARC